MVADRIRGILTLRCTTCRYVWIVPTEVFDRYYERKASA